MIFKLSSSLALGIIRAYRVDICKLLFTKYCINIDRNRLSKGKERWNNKIVLLNMHMYAESKTKVPRASFSEYNNTILYHKKISYLSKIDILPFKAPLIISIYWKVPLFLCLIAIMVTSKACQLFFRIYFDLFINAVL
jgi:hypothetical protein